MSSEPTTISAQELAVILRGRKGGAEVFTGNQIKAVTRVIPTGDIVLDALLRGGIHVPRIMEIYGDESTGKTTLEYQLMVGVQQAGGLVIFIDAEQAWDPERFRSMGGDPDNVLLIPALPLEQTFDEARDAVNAARDAGHTGPIVVFYDTIAASMPFSTSQDADEKSQSKTGGGMGEKARIIRDRLQKAIAQSYRTDHAMVLINQTFMKIGVVFGDPKDTGGGGSVKFYSSIRVKVTRAGMFTLKPPADKKQSREDKEKASRSAKVDALGIIVRLEVTKCKVFKPYDKAEVVILFETGLSRGWSVAHYLRENKIVCPLHGEEVIQGAGGWFFLLNEEGERIRCRFRDIVDTINEYDLWAYYKMIVESSFGIYGG